MIVNNNRDTIADLKKIRAEEKANKIKNHNEKLLKHLKEKHND